MTNQTNSKPGQHPLPPSDLSQRELPIKTFTAETIFCRVHKAQHDPIYFGNSGDNRFDVQEGILYLGADEYIAFRETIGRFSKYRLISREHLKIRCMSEVRNIHDLSLVDLTAEGLTILDADGRLSTGDYTIAQKWAKALQDHPEKPDGIYYSSRHDLSRFCFALFQLKTSSILEVINTYDFLGDEYKYRLAKILENYQYGLKGN